MLCLFYVLPENGVNNLVLVKQVRASNRLKTISGARSLLTLLSAPVSKFYSFCIRFMCYRKHDVGIGARIYHAKLFLPFKRKACSISQFFQDHAPSVILGNSIHRLNNNNTNQKISMSRNLKSNAYWQTAKIKSMIKL